MSTSSQNFDITPRQEKAVFCLLSEATTPAAALKAGVGLSTLRRWMEQPEFMRAYRKARLASFSETLRLFRRSANAAIVTLVSIMQDKTALASARIRAAEIILEHDRKGVETEDIGVRLSELEEAVKEREA
jgi:hypothetical protein